MLPGRTVLVFCCLCHVSDAQTIAHVQLIRQTGHEDINVEMLIDACCRYVIRIWNRIVNI